MNLTCSVKVELLADYYLVEKKELAQALNDYVHYANSKQYYSMAKDGMLLKCKWTGYLVFDNYADMVANLEKKIIDTLHFDLGIKFVDNWNVQYTILNVGGYDE